MAREFSKTDNFHKLFKLLKQTRDTTFAEILEIDQLKESTKSYKQVKLSKPSFIVDSLTDFENWKAFELTDHPGFLVVKNAISYELEKQLMSAVFEKFLKEDHKTNLSPYTKKEAVANIWSEYKKNNGNSKLLKKLRWITFGYHHNWDTKVYSESERSEVPLILKGLATCIASCLGHEKFEAEAGIINIYHHNSSLAGHVDNSEDNDQPLISISLGCTAIFLIGGQEKSICPTPLLLKSTDIVLMSGDSRKCYHAVPCIIENSYNSQKSISKTTLIDVDDEWKYYEKFSRQSRINFNIRQVTK